MKLDYIEFRLNSFGCVIFCPPLLVRQGIAITVKFSHGLSFFQHLQWKTYSILFPHPSLHLLLPSEIVLQNPLPPHPIPDLPVPRPDTTTSCSAPVKPTALQNFVSIVHFFCMSTVTLYCMLSYYWGEVRSCLTIGYFFKNWYLFDL